MESIFKEIEQTFEKNVNSVYSLMNFDDMILVFAITNLEKADRFIKKQGIKHPSCTVAKSLDQLKNIRKNESIKHHYQTMFNQCVVLLVSYFASAAKDIFAAGFTFKLKHGCSDKLSKEDLKLTIGELQTSNFNLSDSIGELFATKKNVSFQDMQSIARAFNNYLELEPDKDKDVNNIILAQACRHAIVHSGGVVKDRIIKQVSHATPREVKQNLSLNQTILFTTDEIKTIGTSMKNYLHNLIQGVTKKR